MGIIKPTYHLVVATLMHNCFVGPGPPRDRDYRIWSNFLGSFTLLETSFTLGEPVSLVKLFRLFRLERIFFGAQSVDTVGRCTTSYLLAGLKAHGHRFYQIITSLCSTLPCVGPNSKWAIPYSRPYVSQNFFWRSIRRELDKLLSKLGFQTCTQWSSSTLSSKMVYM
jgi:hypothetical protein